jgi:hypothetical protein
MSSFEVAPGCCLHRDSAFHKHPTGVLVIWIGSDAKLPSIPGYEIVGYLAGAFIEWTACRAVGWAE